MRTRSTRDLVMPLLSSGVLMAAYLLLRPYGDQAGGDRVADALASTWWVVSHVCGMLALAQYVRVPLRLSVLADGVPVLLSRWAGLAGLVLVLPYYGAEAFALHVVARRARATGDESLLGLVDQIREQPVAITMFGLGLVLLAVSAVCLAIAWQRSGLGTLAWAGWPLGVLVALLLPQYYLPAAGRMAYGVAYLAAAGLLALAAVRAAAGPREQLATAPAVAA
jgi:hypothetical protein